MGRPSKLTPTQWEEVGRRLANGEKAAVLAREFGVSSPTISERFSEFPKAKVRELGAALAELPVQAQAAAVSLADELRMIGGNLAAAARNGSATAALLSGIAHTAALKVDKEDPMKSQGPLQAVAALTKLTNESASMGLAILGANREATKSKPEPVPLALTSDDADG
jgi:hypothetical protein